ncbi:Hypothetical predicted protein [Xyrichtys novacula]|uniref:Uncharacterized protein n=1 Tax=Xyrichtys novacula TaxID=13765 RepID=A0AAV1G5C0_XYRNO|nr:Hypothetical predicted protein [Xyrichtys novacula]
MQEVPELMRMGDEQILVALCVSIKVSGGGGWAYTAADAELESSHGQQHVRHQPAGLQVLQCHKQVLD